MLTCTVLKCDFSVWNFSYFYLEWYSSDTVIVIPSIPECITFHASCFCIQKRSSLEYLLSFLSWLPNKLIVSVLLLSIALLPWLNILALLIVSFHGHYLITEYSYVKVITEQNLLLKCLSSLIDEDLLEHQLRS